MIGSLMSTLVNMLLIAVFIRAILSWFPVGRDNPVVKVVNQITDPILAPIRRIMPRTGMIDFSPMIAMLLLILLKALLSAG